MISQDKRGEISLQVCYIAHLHKFSDYILMERRLLATKHSFNTLLYITLE